MDTKYLAVALLFLLFNITSIYGNAIPLVKSDDMKVQDLTRKLRDTEWHFSSEQIESGDEAESVFNSKTFVSNSHTETHSSFRSSHNTFNKQSHSSGYYKIFNVRK